MSTSKISAVALLALLAASPMTAQVAARGVTPPVQQPATGTIPPPVAALDTAKIIRSVVGCWNLTMGTYHPAIPAGPAGTAWTELPNKIQLDTTKSPEHPDSVSAWRMHPAPGVKDSHPFGYFTILSKDSIQIVFGGPRGVKINAAFHLDNIDGIAATYTPVLLDPASHAVVLLLRSSCR